MLLRRLLSLLVNQRLAYIRLRRNAMTVRDAYTGRELSALAKTPFTTRRLLVGDFVAAEACLRDLLRQLYGRSFGFAPPFGVVHPIEMIEDGLAPVEYRLLQELGEGAGCRSVCVHVGAELSNERVIEVARSHSGGIGA